ncbi:MAG: cell wall hydrolase [Rubrimonas sp.]
MLGTTCALGRTLCAATMLVAAGSAALAETTHGLENASAAGTADAAEQAEVAPSLGSDLDMAAALGGVEPSSAIPSGAPLYAPLPELAALDDEDAEAQAIAQVASQSMISDLLLGDVAGAIDLDHIRRMPRVEGDSQWRCLTEAIYFEARGQSLAGQVAVAEVVLNRVDNPNYPRTICGVTRQGSDRPNACQFSYQCDGKPEVITERGAWALAGKIAHLMLEGRPRTLTGAATHFHATRVNPGWSRRLERTARIGDHVFYRYPTRVASN